MRDVGDEIAAHLLHAPGLADVANEKQGVILRIRDQAQVQVDGGIRRRGDIRHRLGSPRGYPCIETWNLHCIEQGGIDILRILDIQHAAGGGIEPADAPLAIECDESVRQGHRRIAERAQHAEQTGTAECDALFHTLAENL